MFSDDVSCQCTVRYNPVTGQQDKPIFLPAGQIWHDGNTKGVASPSAKCHTGLRQTFGGVEKIFTLCVSLYARSQRGLARQPAHITPPACTIPLSSSLKLMST